MRLNWGESRVVAQRGCNGARGKIDEDGVKRRGGEIVCVRARMHACVCVCVRVRARLQC